MTRSMRWLTALFVLLVPFAATAQEQGLEIDIIGGNAAALPIAVVPMPYQGAGAVETDVAAVVRADLDRSGQFRGLPERDMVERPSRASEVNYPTWRALKQDFLVVGRVLDAGGGSYRVEYELFDVAKQERLLGFALTARSSAMRDVAHQIADAVYEKILGVRGAFWTRIAYITATGTGNNSRYALMVADADGYNPQRVAGSPEPLVSPAWSPDGRKLAYVSFERGNSSIYVQDVASGARELVASFRGINSGPAFSPDGSRLALTLSKGGSPEIYVMDLGSKALRQVTNQIGIDTAAAWSPDGASIYFTSDRGGRPQIYQVPRQRRRRHPRHLPGQLQRRPQRVLRRQEDRDGAGQWQHLPHRAARSQPWHAALEHVVAWFAGRITQFCPQRRHGAVRRPRRSSRRAVRGLRRRTRAPAPGVGRRRRARTRVGSVPAATLNRRRLLRLNRHPCNPHPTCEKTRNDDERNR